MQQSREQGKRCALGIAKKATIRGLRVFATWVETVPARSPARPPIQDTLWEVGWGSGLAPSRPKSQRH